MKDSEETQTIFTIMPYLPPTDLQDMSREQLMEECDSLASQIADDMGVQTLEETIENLEINVELWKAAWDALYAIPVDPETPFETVQAAIELWEKALAGYKAAKELK